MWDTERQTVLTLSYLFVCVYLGVVELHGVICGQGQTQAFVQELFQRVFGVFQEQTVVAEWRHCNWHLGQVVEVLQHRTLKKHTWTFIIVYNNCILYVIISSYIVKYSKVVSSLIWTVWVTDWSGCVKPNFHVPVFLEYNVHLKF